MNLKGRMGEISQLGKVQQKMWSQLPCNSKTLALVAVSSSMQQCSAVKKVLKRSSILEQTQARHPAWLTSVTASDATVHTAQHQPGSSLINKTIGFFYCMLTLEVCNEKIPLLQEISQSQCR